MIIHRTTEADFQQHGGEMKMFVVYENPKDFPGSFVLREWRIGGDYGLPTDLVQTAPTLAEVREFIPAGYSQVEADTKDDSCIVEVWI